MSYYMLITSYLFLRQSVSCNAFLPERDYVTFGSSLSQIRLSVCNADAPYSGG